MKTPHPVSAFKTGKLYQFCTSSVHGFRYTVYRPDGSGDGEKLDHGDTVVALEDCYQSKRIYDGPPITVCKVFVVKTGTVGNLRHAQVSDFWFEEEEGS